MTHFSLAALASPYGYRAENIRHLDIKLPDYGYGAIPKESGAFSTVYNLHAYPGYVLRYHELSTPDRDLRGVTRFISRICQQFLMLEASGIQPVPHRYISANPETGWRDPFAYVLAERIKDGEAVNLDKPLHLKQGLDVVEGCATYLQKQMSTTEASCPIFTRNIFTLDNYTATPHTLVLHDVGSEAGPVYAENGRASPQLLGSIGILQSTAEQVSFVAQKTPLEEEADRALKQAYELTDLAAALSSS